MPNQGKDRVLRHRTRAAFALVLALLCIAFLPACATSYSQPTMGANGTSGVNSDNSKTDSDETIARGVDQSYADYLTDADTSNPSNVQPISIEEQGWWAKDSYVHYGLMLKNPNANLVAANTTIHVVLYDENDKVISEEDNTVAVIGPGTTTGFACKAGNGWAPTRVEFSVNEGSTTWKQADKFVEPFTISNLQEEDKLYFRYELTGDITNNTGMYESTADLCAILRDNEGKIIAGFTGSAYRIKDAQTKSFLLTMHAAPDHASAEVYVQPV